ncbi:MAG: MerR family transcriptional regulator [Polyangiaceae bacterium]|nr:MerR family transcriptional regulator [Polyangiaceae bacterium]
MPRAEAAIDRTNGAVSSRTPSRAASYRMRDLCQLTGLERQTIHFYIQEGLLPEGKKTGRNMAYYSEEHVELLRLIKQLQQERFLPLRAIRAILGGKAGGFSPEQRRLLAEVKERLLGAPRGRALVGGSTELVGVREIADAHGVSTKDVDELIDAGLLSAQGGPKARRIRREDAWLVSAWAELSRAGLAREQGFAPRDMMMIDEAIGALFAKEREIFFDRVMHLGPDEIAKLVERVLPILSDVVARMHMHKARDLFALAADERSSAVATAAAKGSRT